MHVKHRAIGGVYGVDSPAHGCQGGYVGPVPSDTPPRPEDPASLPVLAVARPATPAPPDIAHSPGPQPVQPRDGPKPAVSTDLLEGAGCIIGRCGQHRASAGLSDLVGRQLLQAIATPQPCAHRVDVARPQRHPPRHAPCGDGTHAPPPRHHRLQVCGPAAARTIHRVGVARDE